MEDIQLKYNKNNNLIEHIDCGVVTLWGKWYSTKNWSALFGFSNVDLYLASLPVQFGGGEESSPSDWQTTTSSSSVIYPSKHEYVYVSRYVRFRSAGTSTVKVPFSGTGHVIAVMKSRHAFSVLLLHCIKISALNIVIAIGEWCCFNGRHNTQQKLKNGYFALTQV